MKNSVDAEKYRKSLFIPYELATMAKEVGFDEPCLAKYGSHGDKRLYFENWHNIKDSNSSAAPLYQQILEWLEETHNIFIEKIKISPKEKPYFRYHVWKGNDEASGHDEVLGHDVLLNNVGEIELDNAIEIALKSIKDKVKTT